MQHVKLFEQFLEESTLVEKSPIEVTSKDDMRINDIIRKAGGDKSKAEALARTMASRITDYYKAIRRASAAQSAGRSDLAQIFIDRSMQLTEGEVEKIVTEAYSESQVERLLNMDPIKITVKPDEVTVVVAGNDLGYDDDQYYEISWYPSDKEVQSGAFKDARCTKFISGNDWSEEVKSLEDFADVVNGDADGDWE
jgi:hypothetical protein